MRSPELRAISSKPDAPSLVGESDPDRADRGPTLSRGTRWANHRRRQQLAAKTRVVPIAYSAVLILIGMAFTLWWYPVVHHASYWMTPHDFWSTYRDAHYVGWGGFGAIYTDSTGLITLPAISIVLAPVAMLTGALHMSECFPYTLAHPSSWLVAGPVIMALGSVALFGIDALLPADRHEQLAKIHCGFLRHGRAL